METEQGRAGGRAPNLSILHPTPRNGQPEALRSKGGFRRGLGAKQGAGTLGPGMVWRHLAEALAALCTRGVEGSPGGQSGSGRTRGPMPGCGPRPGGQPGFGCCSQTLGLDPLRAVSAIPVCRATRGASGCAVGLGPGQEERKEGWRGSSGASHQSRVRERAKAWPRERPRAVPGSPGPLGSARSPGGWAGLGGAAGWGCRSVGARVVSPQSRSPGGRAEQCEAWASEGAGVTI